MEFRRQVKTKKASEYDVNSPLARAVAGKSSAIFDIVMDCVEDDLTPQEVNEKSETPPLTRNISQLSASG